jgi:AcrR family transcriptional regulator
MLQQPTPPPANPHRIRLVEGLARAIEQKGYAAATISDIVRHAHVSKRTFYEHFEDKEACFLALFAATSDRWLEVINEAAAPELPWEERIRAAAHAYLSQLAQQPALTTTYLMEIRAAGADALALRRAVVQRFADMIRALVYEERGRHPELRPMSRAMATAVVGGINELMHQAVEDQRAHELADLSDTAVELIRAILTAPSSS